MVNVIGPPNKMAQAIIEGRMKAEADKAKTSNKTTMLISKIRESLPFQWEAAWEKLARA